MDLQRFNSLLLESTGVGLAIADTDSRRLITRNRRFEQWFPDVGQDDITLEDLLPQMDAGKLQKQLERQRSYTLDVETRIGRRTISLLVRIEIGVSQAGAVLIIECQNVTKLKELEYMIESYSNMVERQNRDLKREKDRVEKLLLNIMPKTVYDEWKDLGVNTPQRFTECSILMLDFVDFTEMSIAADPPALIAELNDIFTAFDRIVERFGGERLKTIGDAYLAVCGIPEAMHEHAENIANIALRILRYLTRRNQTHPTQWRGRIGIHSGPVIGSIVGVQKYVYDIFGPGVNLAARLEALSAPMEITLCSDMHRLLRSEYSFTDRGEMEIKGFGTKRIYRLDDGPAA